VSATLFQEINHVPKWSWVWQGSDGPPQRLRIELIQEVLTRLNTEDAHEHGPEPGDRAACRVTNVGPAEKAASRRRPRPGAFST
jgi:hypothetical protein